MNKFRTNKQCLVSTIIIAIIACVMAIVAFLTLSQIQSLGATEAIIKTINTSQIILIILALASLIVAIVIGLLLSRRINNKYYWYESLLDRITSYNVCYTKLLRANR